MKRLAIDLARASAIVVMGGLLALRGVRDRARQFDLVLLIMRPRGNQGWHGDSNQERI